MLRAATACEKGEAILLFLLALPKTSKHNFLHALLTYPFMKFLSERMV